MHAVLELAHAGQTIWTFWVNHVCSKRPWWPTAVLLGASERRENLAARYFCFCSCNNWISPLWDKQRSFMLSYILLSYSLIFGWWFGEAWGHLASAVLKPWGYNLYVRLDNANVINTCVNRPFKDTRTQHTRQQSTLTKMHHSGSTGVTVHFLMWKWFSHSFRAISSI